MNIRPPGIKTLWDDNEDTVTKANILAYSQIREIEEMEIVRLLVGASYAKAHRDSAGA